MARWGQRSANAHSCDRLLRLVWMDCGARCPAVEGRHADRRYRNQLSRLSFRLRRLRVHRAVDIGRQRRKRDVDQLDDDRADLHVRVHVDARVHGNVNELGR